MSYSSWRPALNDKRSVHPNHWWRALILSFVSVFVLSFSSVKADDANQVTGTVTITSINNIAHPNHARVIEVEPNDVIPLSADVLLKTSDDYSPMGLDVEDFVWISSYRFKDRERDAQRDVCDTNNLPDGKGCLDVSNFDITKDGVEFYVPEDIGEQITIRVKAQDRSVAHNFDWIVLKNKDWQPANYEPPAQVVTTSDDYHYDHFDYTYALAGLGRFTYVSGVRVWIPYDDFVPNTFGYVTYVDGDDEYESGITWVGYAPHSWVTEHYGVWRYCGELGRWVWIPDPEYHYCAHTFVIFYDGDYVGWYSYNPHPRLAWAYAYGYDMGFTDGYEAGYEAGWRDAERDHYWGVVCVKRDDFEHHHNFDEVRIRDEHEIHDHYVHAHDAGAIHYHLGGKTIVESRTYIRNTNINIQKTTINVKVVNNVRIVEAAPLRNHPVPESVKASLAVKERISGRVPLGSVIKAPQHPQDKPEIIRPTLGRHGLSVSPRVLDENGQVAGALVSRDTKHPTVMNSAHPIAKAERVEPAKEKPAKLPKYDPRPNAPTHEPKPKVDEKHPQSPAPAKKKDEPKKEEPKKDEPKKDNPKKDEPKKDEPKKDNPKKDEPKKDEPKKDNPKKDEPKKDNPKKDEPKKDEPKKENPKKDEPKKENPKKEEPKKNEPTKKEEPKKSNPPRNEPSNKKRAESVSSPNNSAEPRRSEQPSTPVRKEEPARKEEPRTPPARQPEPARRVEPNTPPAKREEPAVRHEEPSRPSNSEPANHGGNENNHGKKKPD